MGLFEAFDEHITRISKAKVTLGNLFHNVACGRFCDQQPDMPFQSSMHGLEAPNRALQPCCAIDQSGLSLKSVLAIDGVVSEVGR